VGKEIASRRHFLKVTGIAAHVPMRLKRNNQSLQSNLEGNAILAHHSDKLRGVGHASCVSMAVEPSVITPDIFRKSDTLY
jgi:hypothetical protein